MRSSRGDVQKRGRGRPSGQTAVPSYADESPSRPVTRKRASPSRSPARIRRFSPSDEEPRKSPARKSPARKSPARKTITKIPAPKSPSRKSQSDDATSTESKKLAQTKIPARKSPSRNSQSDDADIEKAESKSPSKRPPIKVSHGFRTTELSISLQKMETTTRQTRRQSEYAAKTVIEEHVPLTERINGLEPISKRLGLRERKPKDIPNLSDVVKKYEFLDKLTPESIIAEETESSRASKSLDTLSDHDSSEFEEELRPYTRSKSKSITRKLATPLKELSLAKYVTSLAERWEFGGRAGSILLSLSIPLLTVWMIAACGKTKCSFSPLPDINSYKRLDTWFSIDSSLIFAGHIVIQALVTLFPYGGSKIQRLEGNSRNYCFNGYLGLLLSFTTTVVLQYLNIPIYEKIYAEYFRLAVLGYLFAVVLSLLLFVKSRSVGAEHRNSYANTGLVLYDFWMGREINPLFSRLDVKTWLYRVAVSTLFHINVAFLVNSVPLDEPITTETLLNAENIKLFKETILNNMNQTLVVFAAMQLIYAVDLLIYESHRTTTFGLQYEGTGYMLCTSYALYPFLPTIITKYILEQRISLLPWQLGIVGTVFLIGYYIYRSSNNQKHEFRRNPLNPRLAYLESMPTFHGKKLLVSGWWGALRHPNYLGDLLIHLSWGVAPAMSGPSVAVLPAVVTTVVLLHRVGRDNERCRRRYGAAWQRYCARVPSVLIPKVY